MESKFYNFAVTITVQKLIANHIPRNLKNIFNEFANPKLIALPTGKGNTRLKYYALSTYKLSRSGGGGHFFNSSLPLSPASQALSQWPGDYCREPISTYR